MDVFRMRNEYPGICYRCGGRVEKGEGHIEKLNYDHRKKWPEMPMYRNMWLMQHADCAIKYRGTKVHFYHAPDTEGL